MDATGQLYFGDDVNDVDAQRLAHEERKELKRLQDEVSERAEAALAKLRDAAA